MNRIENKKIIIGAGGGYDIVVASMMRNRIFRNESDQIDIGGFLNPKFAHFFSSGSGTVSEKAVNLVNNARKYRRKLGIENSQKLFDSYQKEVAVHFVDQKLSEILDCKVYDFSLNYEVELIASFLVENYEEIYLCDVGGDILFFGSKDSSVKTPIIDAFSLIVANKCYEISGKKCQLFLAGLGLDGEMEKDNLTRNLILLEEEDAILGVENICSFDIEYLEKVYNKVRISNKGKTNQLLIDIWKNVNLDHNPLVIKRNIGAFKEWFNKILVVDPLVVYRYNPLCVCQNVYEMNVMARAFGVKLE